MAYRIMVKNKFGQWMQLFNESEDSGDFIICLRTLGAQIEIGKNFEVDVDTIQPIIECLEQNIKNKEKHFETRTSLRNRINERNELISKGIYIVVKNSLFDLTNEFIPVSKRKPSGYDVQPIWRIIEEKAIGWDMFKSFNFIKFIEPSLERVDENTVQLKEGERIHIQGIYVQ